MMLLLHSAQPRGRLALVGAIASLFLASCAEMPTGPSVAVMPDPNKPFEVFAQDDMLCRGWAAHSIGQPGHDAAAQSLLASTITGAAIGALAGAAVGGDRNVGAGAAIGTLVGATSGANLGAASAWNAQRRYDIAYQQCMYSKGNIVPIYGYGNYGYGTYRYRYPAPPPAPLPAPQTAPLPPPPPSWSPQK